MWPFTLTPSRRPARRPGLEPLEDRTVPSTIQGTVYDDLNSNGARDVGEPGLQGWLVYRDANQDGQYTSGEAFTRTDAAGAYSFTGLAAGTHVVAEWLREPSYEHTQPADGRHQVTFLTDGETATGLDFGNRPTAQAPTQPEFRVNSTTTGAQTVNEGNGPGRHAVAADAAGNFTVVWSGNGPGDAAGVFAQRYWADGTLRGAEFRINTTTTGNQAFASVAVDADGDFVVVWLNGSDTVKARLFNSDGSARTGEFTVKSGAFVHDVAMDADGDFVVAYSVSSGPTAKILYAQRYNAAGSAQGKAIKLNTTSLANDQASVAMDGDGDFVVAWSGAFQRVDRFGTKQGPVVSIPGGRPTVGMDSAGNFVVAWSNTTSFAMEAQLYFANGTPRGGTFAVDAASPQGYPVAAMDAAGAFAIAWLRDAGAYGDIFLRRFDASGAPLGDSVVANATTAGAPFDWSFPAVTMGGGAAVVVWHGPGPGDDAGVFGQLYASGNPLRAEGGVAASGPNLEAVGEAQFLALREEAIGRWSASGLTAGQLAALQRADIRIADLGGATLGLASGDTIWIDDDAAGWGWFIDPTPSDDAEFRQPGDQGEQGRMDLLTALMHEMGHILGYDHGDGVMHETLEVGVREGLELMPSPVPVPHANQKAARTPAPAAADRVFASWGDLDAWLAQLLDRKDRRA